MTAREEAERLMPGSDGWSRYAEHASVWRGGFVTGAAWAVEETEERVEALARAMWERPTPVSKPLWMDTADDERDEWRKDARAALAALREEQGA